MGKAEQPTGPGVPEEANSAAESGATAPADREGAGDDLLRGQVRLVMVGGLIGAALLVATLVVDLSGANDMGVPKMPKVPMPTSLPTNPGSIPTGLPTEMPTGLPGLPTDLPTDFPSIPPMPTDLPTRLPSLPSMATELPSLPRGDA